MEQLFVDVHSHLDHEIILKDIEGIIQRARDAGVKHVVTNGIDHATNQKCLELSQDYDIVECGMGIYPRDAQGDKEKDSPIKRENIEEGIEFIRKHRKHVVAVSEVGLDFVNGDSKLQRKDFQRMIDLARELGKPIVVHSRKAEGACIDMLEQNDAKKVVMHCFCGRKNLVKRIQQNGWSFSIPTSVVRAQQFQHIIKEVPLSQLFCETDSPFLGPFKDKWNEPSFVVESYKKIAEIKKMDLQEVMQNIYMNWQRMFF